jgi:hypothetical protein
MPHRFRLGDHPTPISGAFNRSEGLVYSTGAVVTPSRVWAILKKIGIGARNHRNLLFNARLAFSAPTSARKLHLQKLKL